MGEELIRLELFRGSKIEVEFYLSFGKLPGDTQLDLIGL